MRGAAYIVATLVVLPYAVLAVAFVLFGRAVSSGSLASFCGVILSQADWLVPWGVLAAILGAVVLAALGLHPHSRKAGAVLLCVLALASVVTIWVLSAKRIGLPELTFLLPCIGAAGFAAWLAAVQ